MREVLEVEWGHFLGWSTNLMLEEALCQTVLWYKLHQEEKSMRDATEAEISNYMKNSRP